MKWFAALSILLIAVMAEGCVFDDDEEKEKTSFTINGRILDNRNYGIDRVTVSISGVSEDGTAVSRLELTDTMGSFSFDYIRNGTYTIKPRKTGFGFYPPNRTVTVNDDDINIEIFTAYATIDGGNDTDGYIVTGRITDSYGTGIADISVGISGEGIARATTTGEDGIYSFTGIFNGTYRVAPSSGYLTFNPPYQSIFVRGYAVTVEDFIASLSEPGGGYGEGAGTHEYFPLEFFASRTMRIVENDLTSGYTRDFSTTNTVVGTTTISDRYYWHLLDDQDTAVGYYRVSADTLYSFPVYGTYGGIPDDGGDEEDGDDDIQSSPFEREVPFILFDTAEGDEWIILDWSSSRFGAFFSWHWTGKYLGEETVTTVAGSFENCRKYQIVLDTAGVGGGASTRETTQTFLWLAPGIGIVKSIETKSTDGTMVSKREEEIVGWSGG